MKRPSKEDVADEVIRVIGEVFGATEGISPNTDLVHDLRANSLDYPALQLELENEFETDLGGDLGLACRVSEIIELVWKRVQNGSASLRKKSQRL